MNESGSPIQTGSGCIRALAEGLALTAITGVETARSALVNPSSVPVFKAAQRPPVLSPESNPLLFPILQSAGDFYDGFLGAFLTYNILSLVDKGQSLLTKRRVPERIKLGFALGLSTAAVVIVESGILHLNNTPDPWDMPGGLVGVACYAGVHTIARFISSRTPSRL